MNFNAQILGPTPRNRPFEMSVICFDQPTMAVSGAVFRVRMKVLFRRRTPSLLGFIRIFLLTKTADALQVPTQEVEKLRGSRKIGHLL